MSKNKLGHNEISRIVQMVQDHNLIVCHHRGDDEFIRFDGVVDTDSHSPHVLHCVDDVEVDLKTVYRDSLVIVKNALYAWDVIDIPERVEALDPCGGEKRVRMTHPAYAVAGFSRVSGMSTMFDSEIDHQNYIVLEIQQADVTESQSGTWSRIISPSGGKSLIRVRMTEVQFGRLVSNQNTGSMNPVTLERYNNEYVSNPPRNVSVVEKQESRIDEFAERSADLLTKPLEKLREWSESKHRPTLKEMAELIKNLTSASGNMASNAKFVHKLLVEDMEDAVSRAKSEVDSYTKNQVAQHGLGHIDATQLLSFSQGDSVEQGDGD